MEVPNYVFSLIGYCMEPMSGDQGLESDRVAIPSNGDESTLLSSENAWTVQLQEQPLRNRQENPKVILNFVTQVEVHALQLQGSSDEEGMVTFILSSWDEESMEFRDYLDSSGEPKVSRLETWRGLISEEIG